MEITSPYPNNTLELSINLRADSYSEQKVDELNQFMKDLGLKKKDQYKGIDAMSLSFVVPSDMSVEEAMKALENSYNEEFQITTNDAVDDVEQDYGDAQFSELPAVNDDVSTKVYLD